MTRFDNIAGQPVPMFDSELLRDLSDSFDWDEVYEGGHPHHDDDTDDLSGLTIVDQPFITPMGTVAQLDC